MFCITALCESWTKCMTSVQMTFLCLLETAFDRDCTLPFLLFFLCLLRSPPSISNLLFHVPSSSSCSSTISSFSFLLLLFFLLILFLLSTPFSSWNSLSVAFQYRQVYWHNGLGRKHPQHPRSFLLCMPFGGKTTHGALSCRRRQRGFCMARTAPLSAGFLEV